MQLLSKRFSVALLAFAAAGAAPVLAGNGTELLGKTAPEIGVSAWINNGDARASLADHRGDVVLLEFWSTTCPNARSAFAPLARLQEDLGDDGLVVIGLTSEEPESVWRYVSREQADVNYKIALGGGGEYGVTGVPHAYLIDGTGKVVWEGSPGGLSKKTLQSALKTVKAPDGATLLERARRRLARADRRLADGRVLLALEDYEHVLGAGPYELNDAATRGVALCEAEERAKELAAQRQLARLLGSSERLTHKLKKKQRQALVRKLEKLATDSADDAPRTEKLARTWIARLADPE